MVSCDANGMCPAFATLTTWTAICAGAGNAAVQQHFAERWGSEPVSYVNIASISGLAAVAASATSAAAAAVSANPILHATITCILTNSARTACLAATTIATGSVYLPVTVHLPGIEGEIVSVATIAAIGSVSAG
ncbi:hypothetical protein [Marinobacter sp.]|uniref:hypothetical protein n=1 Tax=Marinobacter sp. TaxID=50741 RepID=UPI003296A9EB